MRQSRRAEFLGGVEGVCRAHGEGTHGRPKKCERSPRSSRPPEGSAKAWFQDFETATTACANRLLLDTETFGDDSQGQFFEVAQDECGPVRLVEFQQRIDDSAAKIFAFENFLGRRGEFTRGDLGLSVGTACRSTPDHSSGVSHDRLEPGAAPLHMVAARTDHTQKRILSDVVGKVPIGDEVTGELTDRRGVGEKLLGVGGEVSRHGNQDAARTASGSGSLKFPANHVLVSPDRARSRWPRPAPRPPGRISP